MLNLALWLKANGFRADQVQAFYPSPMASATAMYYSGRNTLQKVVRGGEIVRTAKGIRQRRLHKAFLRYHDADNWPQIREALQKMGKEHLIGPGKKHLVPAKQPRTWQPPPGQRMLTQHSGLPPRADGSRVKRGNNAPSSRRKKSGTSHARRK